MLFRKKILGFTLIELIVVIGIIAILAAIVIVAVNPARQFARSRNSQRFNDVKALTDAIAAYAGENNGTFPTVVTTTAKNVCNDTDGAGSGVVCAPNTIDLYAFLVPNYMAAIPKDPTAGSDSNTHYTVYLDATNRVVASAPDAELSTAIETGGTPRYAIQSDGTNDYVNVPHTAAINVASGGLGVSFWVKAPTTASANRGIVTKFGTDNNSPFQVLTGIANAQTLVYRIGRSTTFQTMNGTINVLDNNWHHVVVTTAGGGVATAYVDGVQDVTNTSATVTSITNGLPVRFGSRGGASFFAGLIDDVSLFSQTLTLADVTELYNGATTLSSGKVPVAKWLLDDGTGQTVLDSVGASNGTLGANSTVATDDPVWLAR